MAKKLAPVDLRVASDGSVWHVGNPKAWGEGALADVDPRESMRLLTADEIRFIGPDYVKGSGLKFTERLVALSAEERGLIAKALRHLAAESFDDDPDQLTRLAKRIKVED